MFYLRPEASVRHIEADIGVGPGLSVHFHDLGDGPVVLFLHGSGPGASGWGNFRENATFVAEGGFRCIVADSLGYGGSSKPVEATYDLPFMTAAVAGLVDALGIDRFSLVGNSQGGAQAIRIALDHPGRVDRLVLMAPGGLEPRDTYVAMPGIRSMLRCVFGEEGITRDGIRRVFSKQLWDPALITDELVEERYRGALAQPRRVFETMAVPDQSPRLPELACPVLGMWGMNDQFCPVSGAETLARGCRDARVVSFTRCGHWVMVEKRDVFNRMCLDFLLHG